MTATAATIAAAAKNKNAAPITPPPASEPAKRGRKPAVDDAGNPLPKAERKPAKPKAERLAALQLKLTNFDVYVVGERAKLEASIAKLQASTAPKTIDKDTALATAAGFGSTPAEIKATIAKKLAEMKQLQALSKALGAVSDEELSAAVAEGTEASDDGAAEG